MGRSKKEAPRVGKDTKQRTQTGVTAGENHSRNPLNTGCLHNTSKKEEKPTSTALALSTCSEGLKGPAVGQAAATRAAPFHTVGTSYVWLLSSQKVASLKQKVPKR